MRHLLSSTLLVLLFAGASVEGLKLGVLARRAAAAGLLLVSTGGPPLCLAANNPEAIDFKRVNQEPPLAPAPQFASKTVTLENGVQYFDAVVGDGPVAEAGKSVQFQWVIRRTNGYFVDASSNYANEPFIYRVGDLKKVLPGVDAGIRGMRVGGVRRLLVPYDLAYVNGVEADSPGPVPNDFGPRRQLINIQSTKQSVYFEIKLAKVK